MLKNKKSKSKLLSLLMAIVMLVSFLFAGQIPASALEITTDNSLMYQQYVKYYLQANENYTPVFTGYKTLLDVDTNEPTAYCFEFNNGYIIIDISAMSVYEYSLSTPSPYLGMNTSALYYNGPVNYYFKNNDNYVHTLADLDENGNYTYEYPITDFESVTSHDVVLTDIQKTEKLLSMKNVYEANSTTILAEGSLSGTLTTAYVNGYCGPTAAHCMLRYLGFTNRSLPTHDLIMLLYDYTQDGNGGVNLSSLRNGMNNYLRDKGYNASVYSCSYSFNRVMTEINSNQPLTLGTNGGPIASTGHIQTIHSYRKSTDGSLTLYTIGINDSWGNNSRTLSSYDTNPYYMNDHVYY